MIPSLEPETRGSYMGYAYNETDALLPLPVVPAHRLTRLLATARGLDLIPSLGPDGKARVSVEYEFILPSRVAAVVVSCQHDAGKNLSVLRWEILEHVITPALRELPADQELWTLYPPGSVLGADRSGEPSAGSL